MTRDTVLKSVLEGLEVKYAVEEAGTLVQIGRRVGLSSDSGG